MKGRDKPGPPAMLPKHIRTYMILELSIAVLMAVVLAVRAELHAREFLLIDYLLFCFYTLALAAIFFGPLGIVECYLYRQKKGVWYAWKTRNERRRLEHARDLDERRYWKNAAVLARLTRSDRSDDGSASRTGLFARSTTPTRFHEPRCS